MGEESILAFIKLEIISETTELVGFMFIESNQNLNKFLSLGSDNLERYFNDSSSPRVALSMSSFALSFRRNVACRDSLDINSIALDKFGHLLRITGIILFLM